jgi:hypothetical protein
MGGFTIGIRMGLIAVEDFTPGINCKCSLDPVTMIFARTRPFANGVFDGEAVRFAVRAAE